jgi:hypothetical protein
MTVFWVMDGWLGVPTHLPLASGYRMRNDPFLLLSAPFCFPRSGSLLLLFKAMQMIVTNDCTSAGDLSAGGVSKMEPEWLGTATIEVGVIGEAWPIFFYS